MISAQSADSRPRISEESLHTIRCFAILGRGEQFCTLESLQIISHLAQDALNHDK